MRVNTAVVLSGWLFLCLLTLKLNAQNFTISQLDFTINSGYTFPSITGSEFSSQGTGSNSSGHNPVYLEMGYDYSNKGLLSVYFSDAEATTGNFTWADSLGKHTYYFYTSIVTLGLSSRYYLGNGLHFRPYLGAMVGYYFINLVTGEELPAAGSAHIAHSQNSFTYEAYAGAVYYLNSWLGLDAHAGYGNSYYAAVGLSFRFDVKQKIYNDKRN